MAEYDYEGYDQNGNKVSLNETGSIFSQHDLVGKDADGNEVYGDYRSDILGNQWIEYSKAETEEPETAAPGPGGESLALLAILILVGIIAVAAPVIIWWALIKEGIPAVTVFAILSVGLAGFLCLRSPAETFRKNFRKGMWITAGAFFVPAALFSFVLPVIPGMAAPFSVGNLLGILFISALLGVGPGVCIALVCKFMPSFRFGPKRNAAPRQYEQAQAPSGNGGQQSANDEWNEW